MSFVVLKEKHETSPARVYKVYNYKIDIDIDPFYIEINCLYGYIAEWLIVSALPFYKVNCLYGYIAEWLIVSALFFCKVNCLEKVACWSNLLYLCNQVIYC